MSNLDKLLQGTKVEWIKIKEIANVGTGSSNGNEAVENGEYPFFIRSQTVKNKDNWEYDDEAIIIPGEGGIGDIYHYINGKYAIHQRVYRIHFTTDKVNAKFAFYYFVSYFKSFILQKAVSATVKSIRKPMIEDFIIPLPCPDNPEKSIGIQKEIVRILDTFTELTAELTARKKQYSYYRDQLLSFEDNEVEWKPLREIAEIKRGRRLIKSQLEKSGEYAVFQNCMIPLGYYNQSNVKADTTFIISAGSAGEIGYSNIDFWAADDVYYFIPSENLKSKFLYYFLLTQQQRINGQVRRSSIPRLSKTTFEKMPIPIPPLKEQERIVTILDKFDTLTTSISEGLPKEIELRKKQYEYYRDMLLTFPKDNLKA